MQKLAEHLATIAIIEDEVSNIVDKLCCLMICLDWTLKREFNKNAGLWFSLIL